jgi:hypothetical protein
MILAEVGELIKDPKINIDISNFHDVLKTMDENNEFEIYLDENTTPDMITEYLEDEFNSVISLYLDDIIKEAEEYSNKKRNENTF